MRRHSEKPDTESKSGNSNREKHARKEKELNQKGLSRWVNRSFSPIRSVFAWFEYVAVPTAFSRMIHQKIFSEVVSGFGLRRRM